MHPLTNSSVHPARLTGSVQCEAGRGADSSAATAVLVSGSAAGWLGPLDAYESGKSKMSFHCAGE